MSIEQISSATTELLKEKKEQTIKDWKTFFKAHLSSLKNTGSLLEALHCFILQLDKIGRAKILVVDPERDKLYVEIETFLKSNFSVQLLNIYNKVHVVHRKDSDIPPDTSFFKALYKLFIDSMEATRERKTHELRYRANFINALYNCILNYGLHPDVFLRDDSHRRFNFLVEHFFKSRKKILEYKILMPKEELLNEIINTYHQKLPIKLNGKLIPFKDIYSIKITDTTLLDDEIGLFALRHKFTWNKNHKDELKFISHCTDITDSLHKNPFLIEGKELYRNQSTNFIHPTRIKELKSLKTKPYDLVKLVQLCEELNKVAATDNVMSSSFVLRAIIDHVPPIFGCSNFNEVANSYSASTKSFKKAMQNLNNSLRNIADNNIHSQVRQKESLPTSLQIDFTPEIDLLLSEVVRICK